MKKFISVLLGVAVFAPTAYGFPGMEIVQNKVKELAKKSTLQGEPQQKAACTDFSGHWKGKCSVKGQMR